MANKPIHTQVLGLLTPRERLWAEIRKSPDTFTVERVAHAAQMKLDAARCYVRGLARAGFLEVAAERVERGNSLFKAGGKPMPTKHYRLVRDTGSEAPRVNRDGTLVAATTANQAMWTTLRICGAVDYRLLALNASTPECKVEEETARSYLKALDAAGYLDVIAERTYGAEAHAKQYRLKPHMNTGPKAPQVQRTKRVWDPNLAEVVYQERPELEEERREGLLPVEEVQEVSHAALA